MLPMMWVIGELVVPENKVGRSQAEVFVVGGRGEGEC